MKRSNLSWSRRRFLIGAGTLASIGVAGRLAQNSHTPAARADVPRGWYLVIRAGSGGDERVLVATDGEGRTEHRLDGGNAIHYLDAALSPDARLLAVLKRVPRGSMPSDAIMILERRTFHRLSETEVQIDFQENPPYRVGWSADGAHLAVPYHAAERALIFGVSGGQVGVQGILPHNRFRYHPTVANRASYELGRPQRGNSGVLQLVPGAADREVETFAGTGAEWSPDGATLAYVTGIQSKGTRRLLVRDEASRTVFATLDLDPQARAWSPDSTLLAIFATVPTDPLHLARFVPPGLVPGWNPGAAEQALLFYNTHTRQSVLIKDIPPGFRVAHLQWMSADWLLVVAARAAQSFMVDREGKQRRPVPVIGDRTPLLVWLPQTEAEY